jgi:choline dehydrogenase-like flavoprotein
MSVHTDYDVVTVGGGLGGLALAKVLAEHEMRVPVLERERQFVGRIRGEWIAPWGVAEAQRISIYHRLLERCAHEVPYFSPWAGDQPVPQGHDSATLVAFDVPSPRYAGGRARRRPQRGRGNLARGCRPRDPTVPECVAMPHAGRARKRCMGF